MLYVTQIHSVFFYFFFFYKNLIYKNVKAEKKNIFKNIPQAESRLRTFLFC